MAGGAEGGTDTLTSVEFIQFQDGRLQFDADGFAAQVTRLYDTVLQRAPDQAGLDLWVDLMESGGASLKDVALMAMAGHRPPGAKAAVCGLEGVSAKGGWPGR